MSKYKTLNISPEFHELVSLMSTQNPHGHNPLGHTMARILELTVLDRVRKAPGYYGQEITDLAEKVCDPDTYYNLNELGTRLSKQGFKQQGGHTFINDADVKVIVTSTSCLIPNMNCMGHIEYPEGMQSDSSINAMLANLGMFVTSSTTHAGKFTVRMSKEDLDNFIAEQDAVAGK